jgi:IS5 family transposase
LGLFAMQGNTHFKNKIKTFNAYTLPMGLLLLKQLENFSDERVVLQFKRNPYYQYFCGYSNYMPGMPCNATELVHFRKQFKKQLN